MRICYLYATLFQNPFSADSIDGPTSFNAICDPFISDRGTANKTSAGVKIYTRA
jgi:hypothetical protein